MEYQFIDDTKKDQYLLKLKIKFDPDKLPYEEYRTVSVDYEHFQKVKILLDEKKIKEV